MDAKGYQVPNLNLLKSDVQRLPEMPDQMSLPGRPMSSGLLQFFHGFQAGSGLPQDVRPAVFHSAVRPDLIWKRYPTVLQTGEKGLEAHSLISFLSTLLTDLRSQGKELPVVGQNLAFLLDEIAQHFQGPQLRLGEALEKGLTSLAQRLDLSDAGRAHLEADVTTLLGGLTPEQQRAPLLHWHADTLLSLYRHAVLAERWPMLREFGSKVRKLVQGLEELLAVAGSYGQQSRQPDHLAAGLGNLAGAFFNTDAMAATLPARKGRNPIPEARTKRLNNTLETLHQFLSKVKDGPKICVIHGNQTDPGQAFPKADCRQHDKPLEAALTAFEEDAAFMTRVFRAVRIAQLEIDDLYDPDFHEDVLAGFSWLNADPLEKRLLPLVLVFEHADRIRGQDLSAFSALLCSGYPIHVLLREELLQTQSRHVLQSYQDLAYLSVCHREAVVSSTSLGQPQHALEAFRQMAAGYRAGVSVMAMPADTETTPSWVISAFAHYSRLAPLFLYNPDSGPDLSSCFSLEGNLQLEKRWPIFPLPCQTEEGETALDLSFTLADIAALSPAFAAHLQIIEPKDWHSDQYVLAEYLRLEDTAEKVPFIWAIDGHHQLVRILVSKTLANRCRDRARLWHIYQELDGIDNALVKRKAKQLRAELEKETEARLLAQAQAHAEELERVRNEAGMDTMRQLARSLLNLDPGRLGPAPVRSAKAQPAPSEAAPSTPSRESKPAAAEASPDTSAAAETEDDALSEDPYIDTELCTSCDECINLNALMFKYNGNRQAFIADAAKGTFAQMVQAAEKCPAAIIHPGSPRSGDVTVTDGLVARAAKFN